MTLEKIHIKDRGPLVDFNAEFGPITVIYGPNASGKSLLSNTLRAIERGESLATGEATVTFDDLELSSSEFKEGRAKDRVRVFNADFLRDDVMTDNGPGTIVLGRELIEERDRIARCESKLEQLNGNVKQLEHDVRAKSNEFSQSQTNVGREIEVVLKTASSIPGFTDELRHYNKTKANARYERMKSKADQAQHYRTDAELSGLASTIIQRPKELKVPCTDDPGLSELHHRAVDLCNSPASDVSLKETESDPDLRNWLLKGREYLHNEGRCGFCHQSVPQARATELEAYFDSKMTELLDGLCQLTKQVASAENALRQASVPDSDDVRSDLQDEYELLYERWRVSRDCALTELSEIRRHIETKRNKPNEVFGINSIQTSSDAEAIDGIADIIKRHNDAARDLLQTCGEYESGMIASVYDQWRALESDEAELTNAIQVDKTKIKETKIKLDALRRSADSRLIAADELTDMVRNFLGHDEIGFKLNASDDHSYKLTRHGAAASGFSEGERTALALMYFLKRLEDDSFDTRNGTLVFDDPITSFDEDNLYRAVADMITRTGMKDEAHDLQACKVVIMTHHFGLFERLWMELRSKRVKGSAIFYEMRCQFVDSRRASKLVPLKNMLTTDYMLAFYEVQSMANRCKTVNNPETSLRKCVEGFITRMAPGAIDQGLSSAYWSFVNRHKQVSVRKEDLQLIISIANGGSHLSAVSQRAGSDRHWSTLQATSRNFLQLMSDAAPQHYGDLKTWYSRRVKQDARLKVESGT